MSRKRDQSPRFFWYWDVIRRAWSLIVHQPITRERAEAYRELFKQSGLPYAISKTAPASQLCNYRN